MDRLSQSQVFHGHFIIMAMALKSEFVYKTFKLQIKMR